MPKLDNDRLEEFFQKAAVKADVPFNEEDWKKLEARLDAEDLNMPAAKVPNNKVAAAVAVVLVLFFSGAFWLNSPHGQGDIDNTASVETAARNDDELKDNGDGLRDNNNDDRLKGNNDAGLKDKAERLKDNRGLTPTEATTDSNARPPVTIEGDSQKADFQIQRAPAESQSSREVVTSIPQAGLEGENTDSEKLAESDGEASDERIKNRQDISPGPTEKELPALPADNEINESLKAMSDEKNTREIDEMNNREIIVLSPADAEKTKQKADVELPGAEERETDEAEAMVEEEHASEKKKHVATPRLSLLLSFAPDFTSTSNQYSAPGKAFGAVIHYHFLERWSVSAGVIKNNKKYTGDGEDYTPPAGYWKYYTNGVIPYSIDGSCSVIEFPFMVQYTLSNRGKHKWLLAAGTSSYLMLNESYRYNFEEPNPGAREGWDSKGSSRFYFNMVNFTLGYEYQVLPGVMIGIEPYVKVPIEKIGWTNLKLFSTGASITVRYKIIGRKNISAPNSRPPD